MLKWPYYPRQSTDAVHPYQNANGIFHRTRKINSKMFMGTQNILTSKKKPPWKEEQSWRYHVPWFQNIPQNYNKQK